MKLYDTHCHPYLSKQKSQEMILENFFRGEGMYLNSIGTNLKDSQTSVQLGKKYPGVFATIGIHPTEVLETLSSFPSDKGEMRGITQQQNLPGSLRSSSPLIRGTEGDCMGKVMQELKTLYTKNPDHIVAIGEAGLDYHWIPSLIEKYKPCHPELDSGSIKNIQKQFFIAQIRLAQELGLPLVIHNRESSADIFEILQQENCTNFVFHCFSEDLEFATKLIEFAPECKLGFGGVTTFKSAETIMEAAAGIPLKNIIIETDSPYLTPIPYRGKQENEPLYVKHVLDKIIDLRAESPEEIEKTIFENSVEFFGVK